ncbi:MAG: DUF342 domain-containing protein [Nitrospiraceae bacterium]|nr:DUF342 domain-containing protein [Nitrospiraceae bacterium]
MTDRIHAELIVQLARDKLSVVVSGHVREDAMGLHAEQIQGELTRLRLGEALGVAPLLDWLRIQLGENPDLENAVLLQGRPPVPPVDGTIEWGGHFFDTGFVVDEKTGNIDYRKRTAECSVKRGQLLATVIPHKAGEDGVDVYGNRVRVDKPRPAKIRAGENVTMQEQDGTFYAACDGRVRWDLEVLSVDEVFRVGYVGLESGDINHPGALTVDKDIEEGSTVQTGGDIEVHEVIEAANIDAGGTLTVQGGIASDKDHHIRLGGGVHAKFIHEADVEAVMDICVEREIVHSTLKTCGAVLVPSGRIVGGDIVALGGIKAAQTGSPASVPTVLTVGEDYRLAPELAERERRIKDVEEQLAQIKKRLRPIMGRAKSLAPAEREAVRTMARNAKAHNEKLEALQSEMEEIKKRSREQGELSVEIHEIVYPETIFCIQGERLRVKQKFVGPFRAVYSEGKIELEMMDGDR